VSEAAKATTEDLRVQIDSALWHLAVAREALRDAEGKSVRPDTARDALERAARWLRPA
jgi:hypothetical protein